MPSAHAKTARRRPDWLFLTAAILVGCSIAAAAGRTIAFFAAHPIADLSANVDWGYLNHGLDRIHSFRDTASWWTGTWCGEVPFWRPLTSYVFWGERLLWPKECMFPREVIAVVLHLCFVALGGLLIWRLTGRKWLVVLSLYLFAGLRLYPVCTVFGVPGAVWETLSDPKNVPELLVGIPMLASLLLLLSRRWVGALVAAVIAVCFKETGFTTWPLAVVILAWTYRDRLMSRDRATCIVRGIRRNWLPVVVWAIVLGALAMVHHQAVGIGYNCGANKAWPFRAMCYFGGPVIVPLATRDLSPPVASLILFLAIMFTRRFSLLPKFLAVFAALAVAIMIDARLQHASLDVAAVRTLTYRLNLSTIIVSVVWLGIAWESRRDWQTVLLGLAACLVATIPTWMAAQVLEHARYQATFFMEMAVAAALLQSATAVSRAAGLVTASRKKSPGSG